ncbi:MAG: Hsp20/alpha crystallin family protein [Candidatus Magasanikbacteria bacterium]
MSEEKQDDKNVFLQLADSKEEADFDSEDVEEEPKKGQLTVDVFKKDNQVIVESAIAGIDPDDLDISITDESVTIKGERSRDYEVEDENFFYQECFWGEFSRSIILPEEIDPEEAEATFSNNGILTIKLPVLKKGSSTTLEVKTDE